MKIKKMQIRATALKLLEDLITSYRFVNTISVMTEGEKVSESMHLYMSYLPLLGVDDTNNENISEYIDEIHDVFERYIDSEINPESAAVLMWDDWQNLTGKFIEIHPEMKLNYQM
jgi:hypothetical protein